MSDEKSGRNLWSNFLENFEIFSGGVYKPKTEDLEIN